MVNNNCNLSSDHSPVILTANHTEIESLPPPSLTNFKTDWESLIQELESLIDIRVLLKTAEQLQHVIAIFTNNIQ